MDLKKLTGKLTTIVAAGAMVMSIGGGVVWANNCKDEYAHMSFDESAGEYLDYTSSRLKEDTSCGYIKGIESSNGYSFNATLVGVDETGYCEDFELIDYDVNPGDEIWMYNYVKENGYNYDVNIEIGNFHFPTKSYGDISFPAGNYDALKIEIGDAIGQNWWCVLFPPLCFVNSSTGVVPDDSKNTLKENINSESYEIISEGNNSNDNTSDIKIKFKIIEFFNNFTK